MNQTAPILETKLEYGSLLVCLSTFCCKEGVLFCLSCSTTKYFRDYFSDSSRSLFL